MFCVCLAYDMSAGLNKHSNVHDLLTTPIPHGYFFNRLSAHWISSSAVPCHPTEGSYRGQSPCMEDGLKAVAEAMWRA